MGKLSPHFEISTPDAANLLVGLVQMGLGQMRRGEFGAAGAVGAYPILRGIQTGRVRYKRADPREHWQSWGELIEQFGQGNGVARGDCEDFAAAVTAELLFNGVPARTYVYKSGPRLYHVVVKTEKWGFLDPARAAGMEGNG